MLARYLGMELLGDRTHACLISYEVSLPYHFTLQSPRCVGSLGILELVLYGRKENTCVVRPAFLVSFCSSADWGLKGNPSFMLHSIVNLCQYHKHNLGVMAVDHREWDTIFTDVDEGWTWLMLMTSLGWRLTSQASCIPLGSSTCWQTGFKHLLCSTYRCLRTLSPTQEWKIRV